MKSVKVCYGTSLYVPVTEQQFLCILHFSRAKDNRPNGINTYSNFKSRTRQIIRYRATATLRRPQIKQYTASKGGFPREGPGG